MCLLGVPLWYRCTIWLRGELSAHGQGRGRAGPVCDARRRVLCGVGSPHCHRVRTNVCCTSPAGQRTLQGPRDPAAVGVFTGARGQQHGPPCARARWPGHGQCRTQRRATAQRCKPRRVRLVTVQRTLQPVACWEHAWVVWKPADCVAAGFARTILGRRARCQPFTAAWLQPAWSRLGLSPER